MDAIQLPPLITLPTTFGGRDSAAVNTSIMNSRMPGKVTRNMTDTKGSFAYVSLVDVSLMGVVGLDTEPSTENAQVAAWLSR